MNIRKKSKYNMLSGIFGQIITIMLGIVVPRLVLTGYGSEINGLLNSITSIYSYFTLLEAGVGTATLTALYKTISFDDVDKTNRIMSATHRYYKRTGYLYMIAVLLLCIIYPLVITTQIPVYVIVLVIIFNGASSVINFLFQGKYKLLLQADGKNYIITNISTIINIATSCSKIILIPLGFDVVILQFVVMIINILQMIYFEWYIRRNYSWLNIKEDPDYESISQSRNVIIHQISGLIFSSTDTIILSVFMGLKITSVYSMYTLLFGMISTALNTFVTSFNFMLGQMFNKDKKLFMKLLDAYELYYMSIVFALYSIANFFILPFMKLYTQGVNDINYIDIKLPLLFIATYLLSCGRSTSNQVINYAGHFKQTQSHAIIEAAINLTVSIIGVQIIGIYGVLIGTIISLLFRANAMIVYSHKKILHRSMWITYRRWFVNLFIFLFIIFINRYINIDLSSYISIFCWCIPYSFFSILLFCGINSLIEPEIFKFSWDLIITKKK